jgi:hypothetical protein
MPNDGDQRRRIADSYEVDDETDEEESASFRPHKKKGMKTDDNDCGTMTTTKVKYPRLDLNQ